MLEVLWKCMKITEQRWCGRCPAGGLPAILSVLLKVETIGEILTVFQENPLLLTNLWLYSIHSGTSEFYTKYKTSYKVCPKKVILWLASLFIKQSKVSSTREDIWQHFCRCGRESKGNRGRTPEG